MSVIRNYFYERFQEENMRVTIFGGGGLKNDLTG